MAQDDERLARAMRLSPLDPNLAAMKSAGALAHFFAARYDNASSWAEAILEWPSRQSLALFRVAAASNALGGRLEKAKQAMACLRELDPTFRVSNLTDRVPLRRPEDVARLAEWSSDCRSSRVAVTSRSVKIFAFSFGRARMSRRAVVRLEAYISKRSIEQAGRQEWRC
jgi:hypothetical protein